FVLSCFRDRNSLFVPYQFRDPCGVKPTVHILRCAVVCHTNPKRERGIRDVTASLTLRVGMAGRAGCPSYRRTGRVPILQTDGQGCPCRVTEVYPTRGRW